MDNNYLSVGNCSFDFSHVDILYILFLLVLFLFPHVQQTKPLDVQIKNAVKCYQTPNDSKSNAKYLNNLGKNNW